MVIQITLVAEEHGKIVSVQQFFNAVKSYLPTHGTFHKIARYTLCTFVVAIRAGCAEAKKRLLSKVARDCVAIRAGCAEAKPAPGGVRGRHRALQSVRDVPRQRYFVNRVNKKYLVAIRAGCAEAKP